MEDDFEEDFEDIQSDELEERLGKRAEQLGFKPQNELIYNKWVQEMKNMIKL